MKVELLAYTRLNDWWLDKQAPSNWQRDTAEDCELLIEFAGRECYQSFHNPAGKSNAQYIKHIIEAGHGSVLEHANATFRLTGVSRAFTHELIRHRHLSFSELSQRFVDVADTAYVTPPALPVGRLDKFLDNIAPAYLDLVDELTNQGLPRKRVREAARCVMPNCTETKIVVTGNFRAWRGVIDQRCTPWADAEIREVCMEIWRQLNELAPNVFSDYEIRKTEDGVEYLYTEWRKV